MKRLKIKFTPFIFENQYGTAVLAITCPNCGYPIPIIEPMKEIYDDLKTGKIYVRANCRHCENGSLNELTKEGLEKIQKFCEGLSF